MNEDKELKQLAPIDIDESMNRAYIPVCNGWEVQTKGHGSSFRISHITSADGKSYKRWIVVDDELHESLEQMAKSIHQERKQLEAENEELKRKLAEQQAITQQAIALMAPLKNHLPETHIKRWVECIHSPCEHFTALLAKAKEEGRKEAVPEGWQVVPKEATLDMLSAMYESGWIQGNYKAMLSAAPKPQGASRAILCGAKT